MAVVELPSDGRKALGREEARERIIGYLEALSNPLDTPISERGLAENLGLGRTPVREALRELSQEGVLEVHPTRGTFVKRLTVDEMRELYEVRFALEGMASFLAAERGNLDPLREIETELAALWEQRENPERLVDIEHVGDRLHLEIFRATGNRSLCRMYETIALKIRLLMRATRPYAPGRVRDTVGEHLALCRTVLARKPEEAQARMIDHLRRGFEARVSLLSSFSLQRA
jgi:DNA-binding GntR family transcriptional regulator